MKRIICVFVSMILCFSLCACNTSKKVHLSKEYAKLLPQNQVEAFNEYINIYQKAVNTAISNNNTWTLLKFEDQLHSLYDKLPLLENKTLNNKLVPLVWEFSSLQIIMDMVSTAKAYEEVLDAVGIANGFEGLVYLAEELKLGTDNDFMLYSINDLNELNLNAISRKMKNVISEYFE